MSDRAIAGSISESANPGRPRAFETIVYGGLVVGVLDILEAMAFFGIRSGATPTRVLQSVAGGLLGRNSYSGGLKDRHARTAASLSYRFYSRDSVLHRKQYSPFAYPEYGCGGIYLWCGSLFRDDLRRSAQLSLRPAERFNSVVDFLEWRDWTCSARRFTDCPHREAVGQS